MSYQETLNYMYASLPMFHRVGGAAYKANLDNIQKLAAMLGHPQKTFPAVHVAGTNGKGSVAHMLASILQTQGYRTGLYTSPHLSDFRERIRVNGRKIGISFVCSFIKKHREEFDNLKPSFFEMTAAMAFKFFEEQQVDIAVIETGMGGRLDSTNIVQPVLTVITNIGYDHMEFLGDTLEKIATEKAGIFKKGIPVVVGESQSETDHVFELQARSLRSPMIFADRHFSVDRVHISGRRRHYQVMDVYKGAERIVKNLLCPLLGDYQRKNIITTAACCDILSANGFPVTFENIRQGIRDVVNNTEFFGRWQILSSLPMTICDTGHNESALRLSMEQIGKIPCRKLHIIFGVVEDKDLDSMLALLPRKAEYYFCKADIPRGMATDRLMKKATGAGLKGKAYSSVKKALEAAKENASPSDVIFVGGSTFIVAELF